MKRHWYLIALVALALAVLAGCEQPKPSVTEPASVAALAADPSLLPSPRPTLEAAPDLSGAVLVVNDATLAKMAADAVPSNVTEALASLKGREFTNATEFAGAVRGAVGDGADPYMDRILRNALVVKLADEPPAPEGQVSIAEREQRKAAVTAAAQPMGAPSQFGIVYFDFDKSNIKPEFEDTIKANAKMLLDSPNMRVTIEGHCDERGTNEYNLALGQRRAESVRRALVAAGVPAARLSTVSFGEERPVDLGHTEEAWAKNRRGVMSAN
jgi:peptidoglycan-associated lipoprotein